MWIQGRRFVRVNRSVDRRRAARQVADFIDGRRGFDQFAEVVDAVTGTAQPGDGAGRGDVESFRSRVEAEPLNGAKAGRFTEGGVGCGWRSWVARFIELLDDGRPV